MGPADLILPVAIIACLVPVGLLVIAADGGGLTATAIAFIALVLITAAFMRSIGRAIDQPTDKTHHVETPCPKPQPRRHHA